MDTIRTFIAVPVAERIRNNLARVVQRLAAAGTGYNWVEAENFHVTLNFVGDVPSREVATLCREIKQVAETHAAFDLVLQGVGGFPNTDYPKTLWVGVEQGSEALTTLYRDLAPVVERWATRRDRQSYTPHLTLGRLQRNGRTNPVLSEEIHRLRSHDAGNCHVDRVIVFSSFLEKSGPTYTPMATIKLIGK